MTEPKPKYKPIDFDAWHKQMEAAGWVARRDIFGNIIQYQYERPRGRVAVCNAAEFTGYAGRRQTPAPF